MRAILLTLLLFSLSLPIVSCAGSPPEAREQTGTSPDQTPAEKAAPAETGTVADEDKSVKPGINKRFKDPNMDVEKALRTFEGESREVFVQKVRIAKTMGLSEGQAVADIGSGTGIFLPYFTKDVGAKGKVYAVEISPRFIDHLNALSKKKNWTQVETVFCTDKSTKLAADSIDAAFICDTYHHFEFPRSTMSSLYQAMRPGGRLVIVDFERIPGQSRKWILGHVRCGKAKVIEEVTAAGFSYLDEAKVKGLRENYIIRFKRP